MKEKERKDLRRDLRQYAGQTKTRLIAGALLLLFLVGDGLIYIIYGRNAALMGLVCIVGGLIPVIFVILVFYLFDWIVRRANRD